MVTDMRTRLLVAVVAVGLLSDRAIASHPGPVVADVTDSSGRVWTALGGGVCPRPQQDADGPLAWFRSNPAMQTRILEADFVARFPAPIRTGGGSQLRGVPNATVCGDICGYLQAGAMQYWGTQFCQCSPSPWEDNNHDTISAAGFPIAGSNSGGPIWADNSCSATNGLQSYSLNTTTSAPTAAPPSFSPTESPSDSPTDSPSISPTESPTASPTVSPTASDPTMSPTASPTESPSGREPTVFPTTSSPTTSPTTSDPTAGPTQPPSPAPTVLPSIAPATSVPTASPTTSDPTVSPTASPTTSAPTVSPTVSPSVSPSVSPTTSDPSASPTTSNPTASPTNSPSLSPTFTAGPTGSPTPAPTSAPTALDRADTGGSTGDDGGGDSTGLIIGIIVALVAVALVGVVVAKKRGENARGKARDRAAPNVRHFRADDDITVEPATTRKSSDGGESGMASAEPEPAFSTGPALQVRSPPTAPRDMTGSPANSRVAMLNLSSFESLDKNHVGADQLPEGITIKTMNRYKNILPNPHSRVSLQQLGDDPTTAYINANYITSIDGAQRDYIAAQGPKPDCVIPFWRMLWQEDVKVIIMVTGLIERGKSKCSRYWPDMVHRGSGTEGVIKYGNVVVKVVSAKQRAGYKVAELEAAVGSETRTIMHFWFDSWPDFGVPGSTTAVTDMLRVANKYDTEHRAPWLIHCSAGIGRTGTFIGIDLGMKMVEKLNAVDTIMLIAKMRSDRGGMVQTRDQYEFLHTVLSDFFTLNGKAIDENIYGNVAETGGKGATPEAVYGNMSSLPFKKVEELYKNVTMDQRATVMYSDTFTLNLENAYATVGGFDDDDAAAAAAAAANTGPSMQFEEPDGHDDDAEDDDEDFEMHGSNI